MPGQAPHQQQQQQPHPSRQELVAKEVLHRKLGAIKLPRVMQRPTRRAGSVSPRRARMELMRSMSGGDLTFSPKRNLTPPAESSTLRLVDSWEDDVDLSMIKIPYEEFVLLSYTLRAREGIKCVNFMGTTIDQRAEALLVDAVRLNPTPIELVFTQGSSLSAATQAQIAQQCERNRTRREQRDEAHRVLSEKEAERARLAAIADGERRILKHAALAMAQLEKEAHKEKRALNSALRIALRIAHGAERARKREKYIAVRQKRIVEEESSARVLSRQEEIVARGRVVRVIANRIYKTLCANEEQCRRRLWSQYCKSWTSRHNLIMLREADVVRAVREFMLEWRNAKRAIVEEQWSTRCALHRDYMAGKAAIMRAQEEARRGEEDEKRKAYMRASDEQRERLRRLETMRQEAAILLDRLAQQRGNLEAYHMRDRAQIDDQFSGSQALLRQSIIDLFQISERCTAKQKRLGDAYRQYIGSMSETPNVVVTVPRELPPTTIYDNCETFSPIEPLSLVKVSMDVLWPVRVHVTRLEIQRMMPIASQALVEREIASSSTIAETEARMDLSGVPMVWPRQYRRYLSDTAKNAWEKKFDPDLFPPVEELQRRKEIILGGHITARFEDEALAVERSDALAFVDCKWGDAQPTSSQPEEGEEEGGRCRSPHATLVSVEIPTGATTEDLENAIRSISFKPGGAQVEKPINIPVVVEILVKVANDKRFAAAGGKLKIPSVKKVVCVKKLYFALCPRMIVAQHSEPAKHNARLGGIAVLPPFELRNLPVVERHATEGLQIRPADTGSATSAFRHTVVQITQTKGVSMEDAFYIAGRGSGVHCDTFSKEVLVGQRCVGTYIAPDNAFEVSFTAPDVSVADISTVMRAITFHNESDDPIPGMRTIAFRVSNPAGLDLNGEVKIDVVVDDSPTTWKVAKREVIYRAVCSSGLPAPLQEALSINILPLCKDVVVQDSDTVFFLGGHLKMWLENAAEPHGIVVQARTEERPVGLQVVRTEDPNVFSCVFDTHPFGKLTVSDTVDLTEYSVAARSPLLLDGKRVLAKTVLVEFDESGNACIDAVEDLIQNLVFTSAQLSNSTPRDVTLRMDLLVGRTCRKTDVFGEPLPPSEQVNDTLRTTIVIHTLPSLMSTKAESCHHHYVENSGRHRVQKDLSAQLKGVDLCRGFIKMEIVEGLDEHDAVGILSTKESGITLKPTPNNVLSIMEGGVKQAHAARRKSRSAAFASIDLLMTSISSELDEEEEVTEIQIDEPVTSSSAASSVNTPAGTPKGDNLPRSSKADGPPLELPGAKKGSSVRFSNAVTAMRLVAKASKWVSRAKQRLSQEESFHVYRERATSRIVLEKANRLQSRGLDHRFLTKFLDVKEISVHGTVVGTAYIHPKGFMAIALNRSKDVPATAVQTLLRALSYQNTSRNPPILEKKLLITLSSEFNGTSSTVVQVNIERVDDPTEITLERPSLRYRIGATEREPYTRQGARLMYKLRETKGSPAAKNIADSCYGPEHLRCPERIGAMCLFPPGYSTVDDPDTEHWDGGCIEIKCLDGATTNDIVNVLSIAQQKTMYAALKLVPDYLIKVEEGTMSFLNFSDEAVVCADVGTVVKAGCVGEEGATDPMDGTMNSADGRAARKNSNSVASPTVPPPSLEASVRSRRTNLDASVTAASPPKGAPPPEPVSTEIEGEVVAFRVEFHPKEHHERVVTKQMMTRLVSCIAFSTTDNVSKPEKKKFEISISDADNPIPGTATVEVNCLPSFLTTGSAVIEKFHYVPRVAPPMGEAIFPSLFCSMGPKEKLTSGFIEIVGMQGFTSKDQIYVRLPGTPFVATSDGQVICGKEVVTRMTGTNQYIRFDFHNNCRGATAEKLSTLMRAIFFRIDSEPKDAVCGERTVNLIVCDGYKDIYGRVEVSVTPFAVDVVDTVQAAASYR